MIHQQRIRRLPLANLDVLTNLLIHLTNHPPTHLSTRTTLLPIPILILTKVADAGGVEARVGKEEVQPMRSLEESEMEKFGTGRERRRGLVEEERARGVHRGGGVERASRLRKREMGMSRRKMSKGIWEEWNLKITIMVPLTQKPFDKKMRETRRRRNAHRQLNQGIKVVDSFLTFSDANPLRQTRTLLHLKRMVQLLPPRLAKVSPSLPYLPSEIAVSTLPPIQLSPLSTVPSTFQTLNLTRKIPFNRSMNSRISETVRTITVKKRRWFKSPRRSIEGTKRNNKLRTLKLNLSLLQHRRFLLDCSLHQIRDKLKHLVLQLE